MTPDAACAWLVRHARWADQGWVAFIFTDDRAAAAALREQLQGWLAQRDQRLEAIRPSRPDELFSAVYEIVGSRCSIWLEGLFSGQRWRDAWFDLLLRLNSQRDSILGPPRMLLFVAPLSLKPDLRAMAPDLWSRLTGAIELSLDAGVSKMLPVPRDEVRAPGRLSLAEIDRILEAALAGGVAQISRQALLVDLPDSLVRALPVLSSPRDQMRSDLLALNQISPFPGIERPALSYWLKRAGELSRGKDRKSFANARSNLLADVVPMTLSPPVPEIDVFVIYPAGLGADAAALVELLEAQGLRVFLDHRALPAGEDWSPELASAQANSHLNLWLVSSKSVAPAMTGTSNSMLGRPEVVRAIMRSHTEPGSLLPLFTDRSASEVLGVLQPHLEGIELSQFTPAEAARQVASRVEALKAARRLA